MNKFEAWMKCPVITWLDRLLVCVIVVAAQQKMVIEQRKADQGMKIKEQELANRSLV